MRADSTDAARQAVQDVAQMSYGRLVAYLASVTGDLAAAEDALSEAFLAALRSWPERGVPQRPDSWLVTAARRNLIDASRRRAVADRGLAEIARLLDERASTPGPGSIPDKRLELMFGCTHPAIEETMRSPLMLQMVLGLDAARIGAAFLVAPSTMGQRLVRVKAKIKEARVPLRIPAPAELPERVASVLDAIYAAYSTGWDALDAEAPPGGVAPRTSIGVVTNAPLAPGGLVPEAIRLSRLLTELLPDDPETHGLLALLLHSNARAAARRAADGSFVALDEQDIGVWSRHDIGEAEGHLMAALRLRDARSGWRLGPYQLHAAIQSVHNRRAVTGRTDWAAIAALYDGLVALTPTIGAIVALAKARSQTDGPTAGLQLLDELPADRVTGYQPYWVVRAYCLRLADDPRAATAARRAIELTTDDGVRRHLQAQYGIGGGRTASAGESS